MSASPHVPNSMVLCLIVLLSGGSAGAQSFELNTTRSPQGSPGNSSFSENLSFADIDLDGDYDVLWADGGDCCNDLNRLWVNQGGLQGGTTGVFVDDTAARMPALTDDSRDVDFVDLDLDGDFDVYVSNTSTLTNQGSLFLINQGGLQGGTLGFFVNQTSTRWVNVGQNDPGTSSSVPLFQALSSGSSAGSFITWSGDGVFGDLDNDGDLDLVHSTYGGAFSGVVPSRVFLNDGQGFFEEYNPTDFQLTGIAISNGDPALWAEGTFQHGTTASTGAEADIADSVNASELGDLDGDFDLDLLQGALNESPRLFENRTGASGMFAPLRDVTESAFTTQATPGGNYEQELGDFDNDNDLDLYGLNWLAPFFDVLATNDGGGHFSALTTLPGSQSDESEGDFIDFDNDGDLELYVTNYSGQDQLYENAGAPGWSFANVTATELPGGLTRIGIGIETADVDFDGDTDVFVANDVGKANYYLENVTNVPDTTAPRVILEQRPDRLPSSTSTRVRATVFDNASWDKIQYASVELEYTLDGGPPQLAPMRFAGGQNFSGTLPGDLTGLISYLVRATDDHGNTGVSPSLQFVSGGPVSYCTAGTSASGCQALITASGTPSASAASGFTLEIAGVEGQKDGLFFFAANGRQANPWGNGGSFQCVTPPVFRAGLQLGSGTAGACDGSFSQGLNARWQAKPASNPGAGALVQAQLWYRDPQNTSNQTTSLSDAVEFLVQP